MLQITSINKETAIAPELVSNGNFSEIGSELITDGNFPNDDNWNLGTGWTIASNKATVDNVGTTGLTQSSLSVVAGKSYKISLEISNLVSGSELQIEFSASNIIANITTNGLFTFYGKWGATQILYLYALGTSDFSVSNVTVKEVGQNWLLSGSNVEIGENKAIFNNAINSDFINQQTFTIEENVSYRASFDLIDYVSGTFNWKTTGGTNPISPNYDANGTGLTFDFIGDVEGGTNGVRLNAASISNNSFAVTNVSVKKIATYLDQSIYVTAANLQTISQVIVSYLIELKSMSSQNSIYFIPTSIVANNGRYTKMNFTVVSKDAVTDPADGIISFYDSNGGEDTYPMGFYEFKIYEQTSTTNLNPTLATKLLEKGTAFVQNIDGNTSEITSSFNEYDPTLTQYVYSQ